MTTLFDHDRLRARFERDGLGEFASPLLELVEVSIRLESQPTPESDLPVGSSKLGGWPDMPSGASWPAFRGRPQAFIAQLNLAEVRRLPGAERLPGAGLLGFFFDAEQSIWGFDPDDRGGWTVQYWPEHLGLQRVRAPSSLSEGGRYSPCRLRPRTELTFAPWESLDVEMLGLSSDQMEAYAEALPQTEDATIHRLLGHPDPVQGDMQLEAQLVFHGIDCGGASEDDEPRAAALRETATDWRLLLQIDSDEAAGMMWGDAGRIYYWNRGDDLARSRFDDVWTILQCG